MAVSIEGDLGVVAPGIRAGLNGRLSHLFVFAVDSALMRSALPMPAARDDQQRKQKQNDWWSNGVAAAQMVNAGADHEQTKPYRGIDHHAMGRIRRDQQSDRAGNF